MVPRAMRSAGSRRDSLLRFALRAYPLRHGRKKLANFASRRLRGPVIWELHDGSRMLLDLGNYIDREIVVKGGYELASVDRMVRVIDEGGYDGFIDIGANIGLYTIAVARRTATEIIAFEPDPRNRHQLAGNLFLNQLEAAVILRPEAVTDRTGEAILRTQRAVGGLSTGQSSLIRDVAGAVPVAVKTVALDDVLAWRGRRIAIKMDIESAELIALRGMRKLISENQVFIQIEIVPSNLDEARRLLFACRLIELSDDALDPGNYCFRSAESG